MGMKDVVAMIREDAYKAVKIDTWGNLAPQKNIKYPIEFTAAVGYFADDISNPIVLTVAGDGPWYGPWFYDSVREFLSERLGKDENEGKIFRFTGHWRNYRFVGEFRDLRIDLTTK